MGSKRFSVFALLMSLFGSIIAFFIGEGLLVWKQGVWPEYIVIGIYFGIGALCVGGMIVISQLISPQLIGYRWKQKYLKTSLLMFLPSSLILVGLVGGLLQSAYGFEVNKKAGVKDIILAIDTSGSMNDTDPTGERFQAVCDLVDGLNENMQVALVTFNDGPSLVFDFMSVGSTHQKEEVKEAVRAISLQGIGTTEVKKVVDYCMEILRNRSNNQREASLIFVSDGQPTDGSEGNIAGLTIDYLKYQVPIYTIGMMYKQNESEAYLEEMARVTGGEHYSTSKAGMVTKAFGKIRFSQAGRHLVGERNGKTNHEWRYALLRVCFLAMICCVMGLGLGMTFDNRFLAKGLIIGGVVGGTLGGILLEILLQSGMSVWARGIFWMIVGISLTGLMFTVTFKESYHGTLEA